MFPEIKNNFVQEVKGLCNFFFEGPTFPYHSTRFLWTFPQMHWRFGNFNNFFTKFVQMRPNVLIIGLSDHNAALIIILDARSDPPNTFPIWWFWVQPTFQIFSVPGNFCHRLWTDVIIAGVHTVPFWSQYSSWLNTTPHPQSLLWVYLELSPVSNWTTLPPHCPFFLRCIFDLIPATCATPPDIFAWNMLDSFIVQSWYANLSFRFLDHQACKILEV